MNKKLVLRLKHNDYNNIIGKRKSTKDPMFAFVSPPKNGRIYALTEITYCRESICEYIRQDVRGVRDWEINRNKLHLVTQHEPEIFSGSGDGR